MLKKRMLLLVAAMAAFGAIMASAAVANPTGTASTVPGSAAVGVLNPVGNVYLDPGSHTSAIAANGIPHAVDGIYVSESDGNYSMNLTGLALGTAPITDGCGGAEYSIGTWVGPIAVTGSGAFVTTLNLKIPVTAASGCTVSGGVVEATFTATGA